MLNEYVDIDVTTNDEYWMKRALELAKKGEGKVSPNPQVGAVIIRDGRILGEGWHEYYGGLHAERNAIKDCYSQGNNPEGSTMYVTLEPCSHYGKTPPCTDAIIENKIARVVYGIKDANPLVSGKGIDVLQSAGIEVSGPVLEDECYQINEIFFHFVRRNSPFVILKYAMTADGKINAYTGDSRWVTGEEAREHVHITRNRMSAIMVGINTVISDDPMLNCRLDKSRFPEASDPIRVICDSSLRIPYDCKIIKTCEEIGTIIAHLPINSADMKKKSDNLKSAGVRLIEIEPDEAGHVDIKRTIDALGKMKIDSILIEGGSELAWSALNSGVVSKIQVYIGSKIVGGKTAKTPVGGGGFDRMSDAFKLGVPKVIRMGGDILLEYNITEEI